MPDVNILVYAHRSDEKDHATYRDWLESQVNGLEPLAISVLVAVGFVRVVTHARFAPTPTPLAEALAAVDALVSHPNVRLLAPAEQHWALVAQICRQARASGSAVADAQHAAVAIEHGCTWVTRDADFAAFAAHGLRWQHLVF